MHYLIKNINSVSDIYIYNFYLTLTYDKKNKINKYYSYKRKKQSIIGEMLLKELINKYTNLNYDKLDFILRDKPRIKNNLIYYSISHCNNYVAVVISNKEVGIDIEEIRKTNIRTSNYFATDNEIDYIYSSSYNIEKRLFEIYTLKEAYLKMNGVSNLDFKSVEFSIKNNIVMCDKNSILATILYLDNYVISICKKSED